MNMNMNMNMNMMCAECVKSGSEMLCMDSAAAMWSGLSRLRARHKVCVVDVCGGSLELN